MISHIYKPRRKNKDGKSVALRLYRGRYRLDGDFLVTDVALGTGDKQVAERKLADIITEKEREKAGLIAPKQERHAAKKLLSKHLEDYTAELKSLRVTDKHISLVSYRVRRLLSEAGWKLIKDVNADGFAHWRNRQIDTAAKTLNEYLNAIHGLLNWMVRVGRIQINPLRHVKKIDLNGRQKKRRAFTPEEFSKLLSVAGKDCLIYLTAAYTGLRQNELKQLIWADLHLDISSPYLNARASTTKNRKDAYIPLHPRLAAELKTHRGEGADEADPVFKMTRHPERPFQRHLKNAGLEKFDATGRILDFHSLRYTFATSLAVNGTSQRVAQELMRHSDPMLTAKVYTDVSQLPTADAVEKLPWVGDMDCAQIDSQKLDFSGLLRSSTDILEGDKTPSQHAANEHDSYEFSQPVTGVQMVEVAGIELADTVWHELSLFDARFWRKTKEVAA